MVRFCDSRFADFESRNHGSRHLTPRRKSAAHSLDRYSLVFPCPGFSDEEKNGGKSYFEKDLNQRFPEIPAPFPAFYDKSVVLGQNPQNSRRQQENCLPNSL
jgi:hypothetical protein